MKLIDRNEIREKVAARRYKVLTPEAQEAARQEREKRASKTPHLDKLFAIHKEKKK